MSQDLWEWEALWPDGRRQQFQTLGPIAATEAGMLEHLKKHYRNLNIIALRRCDAREAKQSTGQVDRHAYQFGIWDEVMGFLHGQPALRDSIRERFNKDRLLRIAGIRPGGAGYVPIRHRVARVA
jgi:hypothetical protein